MAPLPDQPDGALQRLGRVGPHHATTRVNDLAAVLRHEAAHVLLALRCAADRDRALERERVRGVPLTLRRERRDICLQRLAGQTTLLADRADERCVGGRICRLDAVDEQLDEGLSSCGGVRAPPAGGRQPRSTWLRELAADERYWLA